MFLVVMFLITAANMIYLGVVTFLPSLSWKPISLKPWIQVHNVILILWSTYITAGMILTTRKNNYLFWGNPCICKPDDIAHYTRMFYYSKLYEFIDTFIMIAKRNFHQVSFLHVYHHSTISFLWWFISSYYPCGDSYIPVLLNSIIHIIMYINYGFNTSKNKSIKQIVTSLQISQFVLMILHSLRFALDSSSLGQLCRLQGVYVSTLLYLFAQFYRKTYTKHVSSVSHS